METMVELINFYKGKKVFITGHTGFKGSWLSAILLSLGAIVKGYALEPIKGINLYELLSLDIDMESVIGDVRNYDSLCRAMKDFSPDIIFHLAAQPIVRESFVNPVYTYETNVMGTVNCLESIRMLKDTKKRSVVNITTDKVYKNLEVKRGYMEDEELCGDDPYSNSKSCSELVTFSYKKTFFNGIDSLAISTARAGNVIGAGDFSKDRIIPDCVRAGFDKKKIEIRNPKSIRPYQNVVDCLFGYMLLAMKQYNEKKYAGSYNFGPREEDCVETELITKLFCDVWGDGLEYCIKPDRLIPESNILMLDSSKAKTMLNWVPMFRIEETIDDLVKLYKLVYKCEFKMEVEKYINKLLLR